MNDQDLIQRCRTEIEQKLNWGNSLQWSNQDFELLEEEIARTTGTRLSVTTLKRIWGKVDYQNSPTVSTMNVLAQFLGYAHWRDYQNKSRKQVADKPNVSAIKPSNNVWRISGQKVLLAFVLLLALSSLFFFVDRKQVFYQPEDVHFTSRNVATGLPNTVIFNYDVTNVIADSFHIQQSWDRRRRVRISQEDTTHTSFYYFPGYFHAKLIANNEIIKQHEVFVESDGWIAIFERFPEPVYLTDYINISEDRLQIHIPQTSSDQLLQGDPDFWTDYYYVDQLGQIDAHNFNYQCRIKNDSEYGGVCKESRISLICTQGRFNIPLSIPGCVSNLNLSLGDTYLQGKRYDLSPLGCNLSNWVEFKLEVREKKCEIYIDNELRMTKSFSADLGNVVGIKFKFNGIGEVDDVRLSNIDDKVIFEDNFNSTPIL